jgi:hypothetical protein
VTYLHYDDEAVRIRAQILGYCDVAHVIGLFIFAHGGQPA